MKSRGAPLMHVAAAFGVIVVFDAEELIMPDKRFGTYALGLLASEMGEALQTIGNALRFGFDAPENGGESVRMRLEAELGDVLAAIDWAIAARVVNGLAVGEQRIEKFDKLIDQTNKDSCGRPLAPILPPN